MVSATQQVAVYVIPDGQDLFAIVTTTLLVVVVVHAVMGLAIVVSNSKGQDVRCVMI